RRRCPRPRPSPPLRRMRCRSRARSARRSGSRTDAPSSGRRTRAGSRGRPERIGAYDRSVDGSGSMERRADPHNTRDRPLSLSHGPASEEATMTRWLATALVLLPALAGARPGDWTRFGYRADRRNAGPRVTGITAANAGALVRQQIDLGGTADSSPIHLGGVRVGGAKHDVFVVTTSYGVAIALDAASGAVLWRFTPATYASVAGTAQITHSSP